MDFREKISKMQETRSITRTAKENFYISIMEGNYKAAITDLKVKEWRNGNLMIMREWTILEGDYINNTFQDYLYFTDISFRQLQKFIIQISHEIPENIPEIDDLMLEILKNKPISKIKVCKIRRKDVEKKRRLK